MTVFANRYRFESLLGQGGMGQVHLAHDTVLQRKVAIKLLPQDAQHDTQARQRFRREALAAAALDHPFICKIHEVGEHDGRDFIVMEFVDGRTLEAVARDGGLTARQLLDCAGEIVQALDEAHRRGIVHRDLKPSNIMLTVHGHVKVLDFGLAKQMETPLPGDGATTEAALTDPGTRLGTPAYMSPEQVLGSPLDPRSDVFSLGTILHEMAGGTHPFLGASAGDTMAAILRDPPASSEGDLDVIPGFGRVVHRMLAKACAERFQSMGELRAELEALRDGSGGLTPVSGTSGARSEPQERTPFVARDAELAELTRRLDQMLLGQGGLVLLGGEPGVGKTRLAREIQRLARARGCLTLTGQCYEQEGAPPFGPFAETVEQSVRLVPQAVRAVLGDLAPEVATIAPVLRRAFPDIPDPPAVPADQQRRVLFNAYLEYVRRGTLKSAVVLLFDDLHWADEPSLQLLLHVAPHLATMRLLVVGTYRDVELDTVRPFARTLETLLRQRLATRLAVKRLGQQGVEQMLATMSGSSPPSSLVRIVHEETDGNPFFVEEVYQHLAEEGRIFDASGRWKANLRADEIDVPEGVRLVISRRLERLGEEARKALTAAAVIGRSFPLDLLLAVTEVGEDTVLDLLEEAEKAQLLVAERGRAARYTFVHELIRGTLVSALALPRRQRLHARIADAIERLRGSSLDAHLPMLAHHLYQAGAAVDAERAIRTLLRALARAHAAGAFEEVLAIAEQLRSLDLQAGSPELASLEVMRAEALLGLGRLDEALAPARLALEISMARGDDAGIQRAAECFGNAATWGNGGISPALAVTERALKALSPTADRERANLQARHAGYVVNVGDLAEAMALGEASLRAAEGVGDAVLLTGASLMHANVLRNVGHIAESLTLADRACALTAGTRTWLAAEALYTRAAAHFYGALLDRLADDIAALEQLSEQVGHVGATMIGRRIQCNRELLLTGDLVRFREQTLMELSRPDNAQWSVVTRVPLGAGSLALGRIVEARAELDAVPGVEATVYRGLPEVSLFAVDAWAGEADAARARFDSVERFIARPGELNTIGAWMSAVTAAAALAILGERAACAARYAAIREFMQLGGVVHAMCVGVNASAVAAGIAAGAAGAEAAASEHFGEARALAERLRSPLIRPQVDLFHGRHLAVQDDARRRAEGEAMLRAAADGFATLKMPLHLDLARRWLASY